MRKADALETQQSGAQSDYINVKQAVESFADKLTANCSTQIHPVLNSSTTSSIAIVCRW